jgi:hypothetical protein
MCGPDATGCAPRFVFGLPQLRRPRTRDRADRTRQTISDEHGIDEHVIFSHHVRRAASRPAAGRAFEADPPVRYQGS